MIRLDGKAVAKAVEDRVRAENERFSGMYKRSAGLAVVLVGGDPASQVYVRHKELGCERVGMRSWRKDFPADISQAQLGVEIEKLNNHPEIDGILVQSPLPKGLSFSAALERIAPSKDVDGLTYENMGRLWAGKTRVAGCTPQGVISILDHYKIPIEGRRAVVIGRSNIVGKPMLQLLSDRNATVTQCHSKTPNLREFTLGADLVVVAAGKPLMIGRDDIKKGAVVIDVGIHRGADGKLCGDVRFNEMEGWASAATPVPGGVGPMTIATLLENTIKLAFLAKQSANSERN